ncbi:peptide deformylase [Chloroflexota bacterium]
MAILPLVSIDNPVLHKKAKRVNSIDDSIQKLIDDMIETMHRVGGVGLAAPQIGVSLQVAVIEIPGEEVITLINPEIVKQSSEYEVTEACLSMPGYRGEIKRSYRVTVKARNRRGKTIRIKGDDLLAQALQHEIDHLNGIVYADRIESKDKLHDIAAEEV